MRKQYIKAEVSLKTTTNHDLTDEEINKYSGSAVNTSKGWFFISEDGYIYSMYVMSDKIPFEDGDIAYTDNGIIPVSVDEGGNPSKDLDKEINVPSTAPVSIRAIQKVMTESYSPEASKNLEISLKAAAKASGQLDTGKLVLYALMLMMGAAIAYTILGSTGGGAGITANIPSGGGLIPGG